MTGSVVIVILILLGGLATMSTGGGSWPRELWKPVPHVAGAFDVHLEPGGAVAVLVQMSNKSSSKSVDGVLESFSGTFEYRRGTAGGSFSNVRAALPGGTRFYTTDGEIRVVDGVAWVRLVPAP
jgi:hypothetical protein